MKKFCPFLDLIFFNPAPYWLIPPPDFNAEREREGREIGIDRKGVGGFLTRETEDRQKGKEKKTEKTKKRKP